jgi:hypothetical protein
LVSGEKSNFQFIVSLANSFSADWEEEAERGRQGRGGWDGTFGDGGTATLVSAEGGILGYSNTVLTIGLQLRLLNTNVDGKQKVMYALTKIKGVGRRYSNLVCKKADVDLNKRYLSPG